MRIFTPDAFWAMAAKLNVLPPWLDQAHVGLYTNDIALDQNTLLADLTEPTFAGYSRQLLDLTGSWVFQDSVGNFHTHYKHVGFEPTDDMDPLMLRGYFVAALGTGANIKLVWAARFPEPMFVEGPLKGVIVEPDFVLGQAEMLD